jgi:hypothetical protein
MAKLFYMQFVLHADMLFLLRSAVLYLADHFVRLVDVFHSIINE